MDHGVAQDRDLGGVGVGLDHHRVHAAGEGGARRGVEVLALQAGLVVLGDRRLARVADHELGRRLRRLVEGVAQRVGEHRDRAELDPAGRGALHLDDAVHDLEVLGRGLQRVGRDPQRLLPHVARGQRDRRAAHHRGPGGERADRVRHPPGVAGHDLDVLERDPELVGHDLGERRLVTLALAGQAGGDLHLAGGLDVHVAALVGADAGALDVAGHPDADPSSLGPGLVAHPLEVVPADQRLELLQRRRVVAGVVDQRPAVLEGQPVVVGELVGLDEVGGAHLGAVLAQGGGDGVHRPLHRVDALRPARAAVGGDDHGVGVEAVEDDPVVVGLVGPEQLGRGDDRHDQPVRRVGAVVVPEPHGQAEQPAVVVEADVDVLHLAPLVGGGDEVLAPVLDELHRSPESPCGHRHQQLLGPRVHDLDPEAAADVGGDHVDLAEVEAELGGDGGADAAGGLGRGPHLQPVRVGVPARDHAPALQRHAGGALDLELEAEPVRGHGDRGSRRRRATGRSGRRRCRGRRRAPAASPSRAFSMPTTGGSTLVGHEDPLDGVLGDVAVVGDHHRDRLADVVDLVAGQRVLGAAVGQRRVRDQQRQRLGHRAPEVVVGVDGHHAVDVEHRVTSMSVIRAWACGLRRIATCSASAHQVVDVLAVAADQPVVLDALDPLAEQLGGHASSPRSVPSVPGPDDQLGGATARRRRCSGSRCSGRGCRRSCRGPRPRWGRGCRAGRR